MKLIEPSNRTSEEEKGKTTKFIKHSALLWCIFLVMGFIITIFVNHLENAKLGNVFLSLNGLIYAFIFLIPIIVFLAIVLKYAERIINRISEKKK